MIVERLLAYLRDWRNYIAAEVHPAWQEFWAGLWRMKRPQRKKTSHTRRPADRLVD